MASNPPGCDHEYAFADTHPVPSPTPRESTVCCKIPPGDKATGDTSHQQTCPDGAVMQINRVPPTNFFTVGQKGYGRPNQHPLFQTTNSAYGKIAPPPGLNKKPLVRNCKFTTDLAAAGIYIDSHFTNEKDKEFIYSPPTTYY